MAIIVLGITLGVDPSVAVPRDCTNPSNEAEVIDCLRYQVLATDVELNDVYNRLLKIASAAQVKGIRLSQRDWLNRRNGYCGLESKESDRAKWLRTVSQDHAKAACLVLFTRSRIVELRTLEKTARSEQVSAGKRASDIKAYPPVHSTWGETLNPSNDAPENRFKVFYFDSRRPHTVVASETVDDVSINYNGSQFHGIDSRHFGAYWVGKLSFSERAERTINVAQGWSKTRIIIDRELIYEGGSNARVGYVFPEGEHLIEVEYLNNWHTTEFLVDFSVRRQRLSGTELRQALEGPRYRSAKVLFAGLYESSSRNLTTSVILRPTEDPVVIVLSSYSAIKWRIVNPHNVDIRAVIYGSYTPGSQVVGDLKESTELLALEKRIGSYKNLPTCRCTGANFYCSGGNLKATVLQLERATGLSVAGLSGKYSADSIGLPERRIDSSTMVEVETSLEKQASDKIVCNRQGNPDFEFLLNRPQ